MVYPVILGLIYLFNITPFFITAPYFFLVLCILTALIVQKKRLAFNKTESVNLILLLLLFIVSVFNFTTIRYSLPTLFCVYLFVLYLYLVSVLKSGGTLNLKLMLSFFWIYLFMSAFFILFLDFTHMAVGDRFIGFTGSPTTYAAFLAAIFVMIDSRMKKLNFLRILVFLSVVLFVYLSKTRLILLFLLMYPLLTVLLNKRRVPYSLVFLSFFIVLFFLYEVYEVVVIYFPELITLRYEDARDASFGLRYYLYLMVEADFNSGTVWEMIFGKGNEHSRLLVERLLGQDIYPHNDFIRLMNDWGILGCSLYMIFLFRISTKNKTSLLISLLYLILFYSNLVFNLFLVTALILSAHQQKATNPKVEST